MLSVKEASSFLGISPSTLYQMTSRREIVFYRVGGKILFEQSDLQTFKESCRIAVGAPPAATHSSFRHLDPEKLAKAWAGKS